MFLKNINDPEIQLTHMIIINNIIILYWIIFLECILTDYNI